jgi:hypothetical protein
VHGTAAYPSELFLTGAQIPETPTGVRGEPNNHIDIAARSEVVPGGGTKDRELDKLPFAAGSAIAVWPPEIDWATMREVWPIRTALSHKGLRAEALGWKPDDP